MSSAVWRCGRGAAERTARAASAARRAFLAAGARARARSAPRASRERVRGGSAARGAAQPRRRGAAVAAGASARLRAQPRAAARAQARALAPAPAACIAAQATARLDGDVWLGLRRTLISASAAGGPPAARGARPDDPTRTARALASRLRPGRCGWSTLRQPRSAAAPPPHRPARRARRSHNGGVHLLPGVGSMCVRRAAPRSARAATPAAAPPRGARARPAPRRRCRTPRQTLIRVSWLRRVRRRLRRPRAGASFCSAMSIFAIVILSILGAAVSSEYRRGARSLRRTHAPPARCTPAAAAAALRRCGAPRRGRGHVVERARARCAAPAKPPQVHRPGVEGRQGVPAELARRNQNHLHGRRYLRLLPGPLRCAPAQRARARRRRGGVRSRGNVFRAPSVCSGRH
jgi:hypothetical protein